MNIYLYNHIFMYLYSLNSLYCVYNKRFMHVVFVFVSFVLIIIGALAWVMIEEKLQKKRLKAMKHSSRFIELFSSDELKEFFNIPEEYRCNPFIYNSEGKIFYADRRNVDKVESFLDC